MDDKGRDYVRKHMPQVGLGTYQIKKEDELREVVNAALGCGYRFVDTAQVYRNEKMIGQALRDCMPEHGLAR